MIGVSGGRGPPFPFLPRSGRQQGWRYRSCQTITLKMSASISAHEIHFPLASGAHSCCSRLFLPCTSSYIEFLFSLSLLCASSSYALFISLRHVLDKTIACNSLLCPSFLWPVVLYRSSLLSPEIIHPTAPSLPLRWRSQ